MRSFVLFFCILLLGLNTNAQSQQELLELAKTGDETSFFKIYETYELEAFQNIEDRVFLANMRMLKIRSYEILRSQYFQLLNGLWGGQKEGLTDTKNEVPICNKKFAVIANIPYVHSKYVSQPILDMLMKERALAEQMTTLRQELIGTSVDLVSNKITAPTWTPILYNSTKEEAKTIVENNIKAQEKAMERIGNWTELIAGVYVAKGLDQEYQTIQSEFLRDLPEKFGLEMAALYDDEYNKHCNKEYTNKLYDDWFTKEYIEVSDKRFSQYKYDGYFDNGQYIDGYRVWIDGFYRPEDYGNLLSQTIYSGRYYGLKLALKRGLSPDTKNADGLTAKQVLAKQGHGFIQNKMRALIDEYERDPKAFRVTQQEYDISDYYVENETLPNFDSPHSQVDNYKVLYMLDGPRVNRGRTIHIRANGSVFLGGMAGNSGVEGIDGFVGYSAVKDIKHGALMYRIGKSDPWKALQRGGSIEISKTGLMQFAVNDTDYKNNSGGYNIQILTNYNSASNSTRRKTKPKTATQTETEKSKSTKAAKLPSDLKAIELQPLKKDDAIALAKSHSYNYNGFSVIYYSNRINKAEIKKTMEDLESFLKQRNINNPKVIYSNVISDNLDTFSVYVNTTSVMLDASYDRFLREIEQVMTYQLNAQFQKSKRKH
ncbi:hypothetical protein HNV08_08215 [Winogradskyella eckloniae]|uniref:hypothetical protein n=1 Tax=Winogradskyella eckloniae TaxID=1089306 RepID=UPI001566B350|nr:hypothetical protein [Winogradskyella eckloniae]NRD20030.1 hypothetical protein [Winogradskyella eckloniae]